MNRVKDKVAIVTGDALGIGRATCLSLANEGAKVAVVDLLDKEGKPVVDEIKGKNGEADYGYVDVTSEKQVQSTFADIAKTFGGIHVPVNNAGRAGINKPTHEIREQEWDKVIAVAVRSMSKTDAFLYAQDKIRINSVHPGYI